MLVDPLDTRFLITLCILVVLVIAYAACLKRKIIRTPRWALLSIPLIIAGFIFSEAGYIGYGMIDVGILFAAIDIIIGFRAQEKTRNPPVS